jgi:hypothetical protein
MPLLLPKVDGVITMGDDGLRWVPWQEIEAHLSNFQRVNVIEPQIQDPGTGVEHWVLDYVKAPLAISRLGRQGTSEVPLQIMKKRVLTREFLSKPGALL